MQHAGGLLHEEIMVGQRSAVAVVIIIVGAVAMLSQSDAMTAGEHMFRMLVSRVVVSYRSGDVSTKVTMSGEHMH